jgi:hypothetical protein
MGFLIWYSSASIADKLALLYQINQEENLVKAQETADIRPQSTVDPPESNGGIAPLMEILIFRTP